MLQPDCLLVSVCCDWCQSMVSAQAKEDVCTFLYKNVQRWCAWCYSWDCWLVSVCCDWHQTVVSADTSPPVSYKNVQRWCVWCYSQTVCWCKLESWQCSPLTPHMSLALTPMHLPLNRVGNACSHVLGRGVWLSCTNKMFYSIKPYTLYIEYFLYPVTGNCNVDSHVKSTLKQ